MSYKPGSRGEVEGAELRYGGRSGAMLSLESSIAVKDSTFRQSAGDGVEARQGNPSISGSTFDRNSKGIAVFAPAEARVEGNTVDQSSFEGILFWNPSPFPSGQVQATGNTVRRSGSEGIEVLGGMYGFSGGEISANTLTGNG